ncbi:hypothetical protein BS78_09G004700 [Paspalum vaginatum]|nr:hypothetical protein BS78_09G004700 [Paspalum vaginatum]
MEKLGGVGVLYCHMIEPRMALVSYGRLPLPGQPGPAQEVRRARPTRRSNRPTPSILEYCRSLNTATPTPSSTIYLRFALGAWSLVRPVLLSLSLSLLAAAYAMPRHLAGQHLFLCEQ